MKPFKLILLGLALAWAADANAQVFGAGPYGVGTPVATPANSQYTPGQAYYGQFNNGYNQGYGSAYGSSLVPDAYGAYSNDGTIRRHRRHRRSRRNVNLQNQYQYQYGY